MSSTSITPLRPVAQKWVHAAGAVVFQEKEENARVWFSLFSLGALFSCAMLK